MSVPLTGTLSQYAGGTFPTHNDQIGWGGMRCVADHAARDAIPTLQARLGMIVVCQSDAQGICWQLTTYPPTGTDGDWTQASFSGTGTVTLTGDATGSGSGSITTTVSSYNGGTAFGTMAAENSSSVAITGGTITGLPTPTLAADAANKAYVDSLSFSLSPKLSCRVLTTGALTATYANGSSGVGATLTNSTTQAAIAIDGVTLGLNDRVLVNNQAAPAQNGIYAATTLGSVSTNWVLTRATDFDQASEVSLGSYTVISEGTVNHNTLWIETGPGPFTIGTTAILFTQLIISGTGTVTSIATGTGLTGGPISSTGTISIAAGGVGTTQLAANAVTYAKLQSESASTLLGNPTGSGAVPSEITLGAGLSFSGTTLTVDAGGTGTVTSVATGTGLTGGPITTTGTVSVASGGIGTTQLAANAVTYAKLQSESASTLLGNPTGSGAVPSEITLGTGLAFIGTTLTASGSGGTVTSIVAGTGLAGGTITTTGTITLGSIAANTILANNTSGSAIPSGVTTKLQVDSHQGAIGTGSIVSTTCTFDLSLHDWYTLTLSHSATTTLALSNPTVGQQFTLVLTQDGTGTNLVNWFTTLKWPGGTVPTLTTTAGGIDVFTFKCMSSGQYYGFTPGQALA